LITRDYNLKKESSLSKEGKMKRIGLMILFLLFAQNAFAAPQTGFYFGFAGGYVIPQTMSFSDPDDGYEYFDATLENGYNLAVKTGWLTPFTQSIMAMEIEYNYFNHDFDKSKVIPSPDYPLWRHWMGT